MANTTHMGRPTVFSKTTLQKLEGVFAIGGSDKEACVWADIAPSSLYNYQVAHPAFLERKELLKEKPILKARKIVIKAMEKNPRLAFNFLERRKRNEFALRVEMGYENIFKQDEIKEYD